MRQLLPCHSRGPFWFHRRFLCDCRVEGCGWSAGASALDTLRFTFTTAMTSLVRAGGEPVCAVGDDVIELERVRVCSWHAGRHIRIGIRGRADAISAGDDFEHL